MRRVRGVALYALGFAGILLALSYWPVSGQQPAAANRVTLFEGARLIVGDGSAPIARSAFTVQGNRITAVGVAGGLRSPAGAIKVDLTGKTVMPAVVDTHSHIGYYDEVADKEAESNFTHAKLLDDLDRFAYTGHALTYSLGSDMPDFIDPRYSDNPKTFV